MKEAGADGGQESSSRKFRRLEGTGGIRVEGSLRLLLWDAAGYTVFMEKELR